MPETSRETSARIKAVLFDADGVLQGARPGWKERLTGLVPPERGAEFLDEVFAAELPPLRGEGSFPDELAKVLTRWNLTVDVHDVLTVWNDIEVYDDALDVVREVRATGTTVCLATNQQAYRALYMRANLGYDTLFDAEFYSCDLRLAKPDPAYFQAPSRPPRRLVRHHTPPHPPHHRRRPPPLTSRSSGPCDSACRTSSGPRDQGAV